MKVVVHLNHGVDKSYMLNFGNKVKKEDVEKLLKLGQNDAAYAIYNYARISKSVQMVELDDKEKLKMGNQADFVVGYQGYIAERLA